MDNEQMIRQTKFGWVDLSNISKRGKLFDWKNSIGKMIWFQYKDIYTHMIIVEYIDHHTLVVTIPDYNSNCTMSINNILRGKLASAVNKRTAEFIYHVDDMVNGTLLILSTYKSGRYKCYNYKCLIDGYEGHIYEDDLRRGHGCPVCANQKVMQGVNDIATTNQDIASLFLNKEDSYKYTAHSTKNVDFVCPRCGNVINQKIHIVTDYGLSCKRCGDGLSYPEKFIYSFLQQIGDINQDNILLRSFETQKIFDWSKNIQHLNQKLSGNKRYDFYIPLQNQIIIEAHGEQHFKQCLYHVYKNSKTLEEERTNDRLKMNLAIKNGILQSNYIQLDCCESNMEYIKNSIMNSNLPQLLHFTEDQINWQKCNSFATSSRVFEACELWNNGLRSTKQIAINMGLDQSTVRHYLRRGEELGIVPYPPNAKRKNYSKKLTFENNQLALDSETRKVTLI